MQRFKLDWPGVVAFGLTIVAAVVIGLYVDMEAATLLAGLAGGLLLKFGALDVSKKDVVEVDLDIEDATPVERR